MKKIISSIMALAMLASLSTTAFASNGIGNGGSDSAEVYGTYQKGGDTEIVYSVDVSWTDFEFTYNGASKGTWNPETHQYDNSTEAGWADDKGTITVTNHSNTAVEASVSYKAAEGFESAGMEFDKNVLELSTADNGLDGAAGTPVTGTVTVTPTGSLPENAKNTVIGTITITIN